MIERGADDWNRGIECACEGGYRDLMNLMIQHGASEFIIII